MMNRRPLSQTPDRQDAHYIVHKTLQRLILSESQGPYEDRDQILHQLRGMKEKRHRQRVLENFAREPSCWRLACGQQNQALWAFGQTPQSKYSALQRIIDCHNKSTAIYLLDPQQQGAHLRNGIWKFIDVWLYRQWFKPYESHIDHGRYLAKSMSLVWDKDTAEPTLTDVADFHMNLCQDLSADPFRRLPHEFLEALPISRSLAAEKVWNGGREELLAALGRVYILQPLFKAVFIVLDQTLGPTEGPFDAQDIGNFSVSLVQTGCTKGLSGPISFDVLYRNGDVLPGPNKLGSTVCSVRTTFKAGVQFILDLENREMATFGVKPDPSLLDNSVDLEEEARKLGWNESTHGKVPADQPSSRWVDRCKHQEWTGAGALYHARSVWVAIRFLEATRRKCPLQDDWWWWDST
ncbi:hypothetical protein B0T10DRAFT_512022 [Thelonectria olida]|uniref:Uncharacterized protein n=1 Tax=Thelonectria olida TaxID=1576542 RepID=A0A9P8W7D8_9HYPO|nr:hypothetical protein B0T10DRAFT_512022 [Thelonectria olida]